MVLVLVICLIFGLKTLHHHPQGNNDPKGNDGSPNVEYKNIDVVHYGAAGDGKTDDSQVNILTQTLKLCIQSYCFLI